MKHITIAGAGLAGTLLSLLLARRGYSIDILESRPDMRKNAGDFGRSINLALSCRGITALKTAGIMDQVDKIRVPMRARAIHEPDESIKYQPFGRHNDEYINSISRAALNILLLDEAEKCPQIRIHFDHKIQHIDFLNRKLHLMTEGKEKLQDYTRLIGADGAASAVRESMKNEGFIQSQRVFLPHGYKELSISRAWSTDLAREHLHLWPRGKFMLLGNPNPDDSITGTLFLANEGPDSFETLDDPFKVQAFFEQYFNDISQNMPDLTGEFFRHPTGHLSTISAAPWYYKDECLLLGDAAHGVVPFFGQGMNSAFEDCRVLSEMLALYKDDWVKTIPAFYKDRKINTDAIARLSMENYHEIQSDICDSKFLLQKKVEKEIMRRYPEKYVSMHVRVMFTNTPYAEAEANYALQKDLLHQICASINSIEEVSWEKTEELIKNMTKI